MTTVLIAIAAFIPVLGILVVVHELGHYWTARAFGIKVLEFGFGYPPASSAYAQGVPASAPMLRPASTSTRKIPTVCRWVTL